MEQLGIEPKASEMQTQRSTTELQPLEVSVIDRSEENGLKYMSRAKAADKAAEHMLPWARTIQLPRNQLHGTRAIADLSTLLDTCLAVKLTICMCMSFNFLKTLVFNRF
jgi:hypothetical protein